MEEANGQLTGFEFRFARKTARVPASWVENYLEAGFQVFNRENFWHFLS